MSEVVTTTATTGTTGTTATVPSPATTTTSGPMSASDALAFADSSFAIPATDTTPAATGEAVTTAQPAATTEQTTIPASTEADPTKAGEPPQEKWPQILENARKKEAERVRQEVEQQFGWAKDISPDDRQSLLNIRHALTTNPAEFIAQAWALLENDPQHAPALKSQAARLLGSRQQQADTEPEPDAAIRLEDGTQVPVYTAEGLKKRDAWLRKQLAPELESQLTEKFKPLANTAERLRQQEEREQRVVAADSWASQVLAPVSRLPNFKEFKADIGKALTDLPKTATEQQMTDVVYDTYARLHQAQLDALTKDGESKALANLQQRAVASTTNPATASTSTPKNMIGNARAALKFAGVDED